ncbi:MAG: class I SAM-dependent methyltransferase [Acidimicrobiales bacterium]|jgi:SAM-dependent methyltransferase|nr:class I SAM-dependent methyltransferase [Acidimicrobiales bacterium]
MEGYGPDSYGESFADVYDDWYADVSDVDATVAGILALADGGAVLELGIGTGRLALPLAAAGLAVTGVDASPAMLDALRAKPGADVITLVEADMADPPLEADAFAIAFAAFNTFFNLTTTPAQQRCAAALARAVRPGGFVVIEGFVPPEGGLSDGGVSVREIAADRAVLTASEHEADAQVIRGQHIDISNDGIRMRPWQLHYRTPEQLDALFTEAGFEFECRHAGWSQEPFSAAADVHVSVYRRPPG